MDGGGDKQRTVHFLRSQENRRRVHGQRRPAIPIHFSAPTPGFRTGPGPFPEDDGVREMPRLGLVMAELAEDSGFESGSEGE